MRERSVFRNVWFWLGAFDALLAAADLGVGGHSAGLLANVALLAILLAFEEVRRLRAEDRLPKCVIQLADFRETLLENVPTAEREAVDYALSLAIATHILANAEATP